MNVTKSRENFKLIKMYWEWSKPAKRTRMGRADNTKSGELENNSEN